MIMKLEILLLVFMFINFNYYIKINPLLLNYFKSKTSLVGKVDDTKSGGPWF